MGKSQSCVVDQGDARWAARDFDSGHHAWLMYSGVKSPVCKPRDEQCHQVFGHTNPQIR